MVDINNLRGERAVKSERLRSRGRGATAEERKLSRAAFKGWDSRLRKTASNENSSRR